MIVLAAWDHAGAAYWRTTLLILAEFACFDYSFVVLRRFLFPFVI